MQFVQLAHGYEQREVFELLAERVVQAGKVCAVIQPCSQGNTSSWFGNEGCSN